MRTFVIGDIHGAHKALLQCFERSGFDRTKDRLIALGDVCDVYPEVRQCVDELIALKHCDFIIGNHDLWTLDWATRGLKPAMWLEQGGDQTILSYGGGPMPSGHVEFLNKAHPWLEADGRVFVHGGFDPDRPLGVQSLNVLAWDRDLLRKAWEKEKAGCALRPAKRHCHALRGERGCHCGHCAADDKGDRQQHGRGRQGRASGCRGAGRSLGGA